MVRRLMRAGGVPVRVSTDVLAWALTYARMGWPIFPVVPGEKRPAIRGWQREATTDPTLIRRWWPEGSARNIGLVTGFAFDAFDIEVEHLERLRAGMERHRLRWPGTPVARTGRGGIHVLVRPVGRSGRRIHLDGVHIGEVKGRGGFIVAAPSCTTGPYTWVRSPLEAAVAEAPDWLRDLAVAPPPPVPFHVRDRHPGIPVERRLAPLARAVALADVGNRNNMLFWAMCTALRDGLGPAEVAPILEQRALSAGLGQREVGLTIRSAIRTAQASASSVPGPGSRQ